MVAGAPTRRTTGVGRGEMGGQHGPATILFPRSVPNSQSRSGCDFSPRPARRGAPSKLVNSNYFRVEVQLPFSGGPSAGGLAAFLDDNGVHDITVEPLMDETLWGGPPEFPRYLAVGTRPPSA